MDAAKDLQRYAYEHPMAVPAEVLGVEHFRTFQDGRFIIAIALSVNR